MSWQNEVDLVVGNKQEVARVERMPLKTFLKYLEDRYSVSTFNFETNGHQTDFWLEVTVEGSKFELSGDLWYYSHYEFYKTGEE